MAFTDHCDVFGSFHEEGFNRIIDHIRFQRPSMFNYATQAIADNPALLCRPIVAHPRLNQHGNPLVTIIDPLPLPGANFALNFSVQLVDVKIDFHPANVVTLPAELSPLGVQRFVISLRVCAGIGCPPAQAISDNIPPPPDPDADPNLPPPPPPPQVVLPPDQQLICVCLDAFAGGRAPVQGVLPALLPRAVRRSDRDLRHPAARTSRAGSSASSTRRSGWASCRSSASCSRRWRWTSPTT